MSLASDPTLLAHLTPAERAALTEFLAAARRLLGPSLLDARLFGSRARGEGNEDSDIDVALIVTAEGRRQRYPIYDVAYDIGLAHGVELSPIVLEKERLDMIRRRELLFARELDRDGVPL